MSRTRTSFPALMSFLFLLRLVSMRSNLFSLSSTHLNRFSYHNKPGREVFLKAGSHIFNPSRKAPLNFTSYINYSQVQFTFLTANYTGLIATTHHFIAHLFCQRTMQYRYSSLLQCQFILISTEFELGDWFTAP